MVFTFERKKERKRRSWEMKAGGPECELWDVL